MRNMFRPVKRGTFVFLAKRYDPFEPLRGILPDALLNDVNLIPIIKKAALFTLIGLIIVAFIITSMPHIFLA